MLPSIDRGASVPTVQEADALLVWGGDPLYLDYWIRQSGLMDLMPSLRHGMVYVGVSPESIAATSIYGETYHNQPNHSGGTFTSEEIVFATPQGDISRILVTAQGVRLVDFAIIPRLDNANHEDASLANSEKWAARIPAPTYAIDDQTAIKVVDGHVEVVSEGHWKPYTQ